MRSPATGSTFRSLAITALALLALVSWSGWAAAGPTIPSNDQDATFGNGGIVVTDLPPIDEEAKDLAVQADGKILAIGPASGRVPLLRYLTDGDLDPAFHISTHAFGTGVAVQPDQKIILAGNVGE